MIRSLSAAGWLTVLTLVAVAPASAAEAASVDEQRALILQLLRTEHGLSDEQVDAVGRIFAQASVISQGNPTITRHPMTPEECRVRRQEAGLVDRSSEFEAVCGGAYMAPLYDPATQTPRQATSCIDQYEFPNVPCAYPLVWVKTSEAAEICAPTSGSST